MSRSLMIEPTTDAALVARLNRAIQEHHLMLCPEAFKPHDEEAVRTFMEKQLQDPAWHCRVAYLDGREVGYVLFYLREYSENPFRRAYRGVHVDQLSVLPGLKRKGVGRALMAEAEAFARRENAFQLELTFWERNGEARGFYEKLGFSTAIRFVVKALD